MKASQLAEKLLQNPDMEVMIMDGPNGNGFPRTINFGPIIHIINEGDEFVTDDCEGKVGTKVLLIGYGSY